MCYLLAFYFDADAEVQTQDTACIKCSTKKLPSQYVLSGL